MISQRAFIGGLANEVTVEDVEGRFKSFGKLSDVYVAAHVDGGCRGFGHFTLDTTRKEWLKCVNLFNGAKWKGHVLKIEEANKSWTTKRTEDQEKQARLEKKEHDAMLKKKRLDPVKYAEDMSLITDKNMDGKRGWKRGRYGRPVVTMRFEKMTYDPSHYKNNLEKLFNQPGRPLPLNQLVYEIDENEPIPKAKHHPTEVALAAFLNKSTAAAAAATMTTTGTKPKGPTVTPATATAAATKTLPASSSSEELMAEDEQVQSADRDRMRSVLAMLDMSPKASGFDDSDLEEEMAKNNRNRYDDSDVDMDGGEGEDSNDLFDGLPMAASDRESRAEDLFADDDDEESAPQPNLDFLEEEEEEDSDAEADEDDDEEEEYDDEERDADDVDEEVSEELAKAVSRLKSASTGGLFSDDEGENLFGKETEASDLFDEDDDASASPVGAERFAKESEATRIRANEKREQEMEAANEARQKLISAQLANIDSREKRAGHIAFDDADTDDSEDYERMEAEHAKALAKSQKSIFDSSDDEVEEDQDALKSKSAATKKSGKSVMELFASDDDEDNEEDGFGMNGKQPDLAIKERFEGPGGRALFEMQTKIGTKDSRFQLTADFLDHQVNNEDDKDFMDHQNELQLEAIRSTGAGIELDEDQQIRSDVGAEKLQAMDVLKAMFGEEGIRNKKKEEDMARKKMGGTGTTLGLIQRYDPDAHPEVEEEEEQGASDDDEDEESDSDEQRDIFSTKKVSSAVTSESEEDKEEELDKDHTDEEKQVAKAEEPTEKKKKSVGFSFGFDDSTFEDKEETTETAIKSDGTRSFTVATDIKSLFAVGGDSQGGSFKMFGGDLDMDDEEAEEGADGANSVKTTFGRQDDGEDSMMMGVGHESTPTASSLAFSTFGGAGNLNRPTLGGSGNLFFFHFGQPKLLKRSNYRQAIVTSGSKGALQAGSFVSNPKVFMRTESVDEITAKWEETRKEMTNEFKRKHRSAARNKDRAQKRYKSNAISQKQQESERLASF